MKQPMSAEAFDSMVSCVILMLVRSSGLAVWCNEDEQVVTICAQHVADPDEGNERGRIFYAQFDRNNYTEDADVDAVIESVVRQVNELSEHAGDEPARTEW